MAQDKAWGRPSRRPSKANHGKTKIAQAKTTKSGQGKPRGRFLRRRRHYPMVVYAGAAITPPMTPRLGTRDAGARSAGSRPLATLIATALLATAMVGALAMSDGARSWLHGATTGAKKTVASNPGVKAQPRTPARASSHSGSVNASNLDARESTAAQRKDRAIITLAGAVQTLQQQQQGSSPDLTRALRAIHEPQPSATPTAAHKQAGTAARRQTASAPALVNPMAVGAPVKTPDSVKPYTGASTINVSVSGREAPNSSPASTHVAANTLAQASSAEAKTTPPPPRAWAGWVLSAVSPSGVVISSANGVHLQVLHQGESFQDWTIVSVAPKLGSVTLANAAGVTQTLSIWQQ